MAEAVEESVQTAETELQAEDQITEQPEQLDDELDSEDAPSTSDEEEGAR